MVNLETVEEDSLDVATGFGYLIVLGYVLLGISVLCEEYFVSSLNVIVETYDIPPEVAGATLMAAGTSSPELFAAIVGLFFSNDSDTGISTVVGSVVFNTLMIIGVSILVSPTGDIILQPAPLLREVVFYSAALILLFLTLGDGMVDLWEASLMVTVYLMYVMWAVWGNDMVLFLWKTLREKQKGYVEGPGSDENPCSLAPSEESNSDGIGATAPLPVETENGVLSPLDGPGNVDNLEKIEMGETVGIELVSKGEPKVDSASCNDCATGVYEKCDDSETSSLLASESGEIEPELLAEVNELLTVFFMNCVIHNFYRSVPEEVANHPGLLDYIMDWVQKGVLVTPSSRSAESDFPDETKWLLKFGSESYDEKFDKDESLKEAVEKTKKDVVSREELGSMIVLKMNANRLTAEDILKMLPLTSATLIPMREIFNQVTTGTDEETGSAESTVDVEATDLQLRNLRVERLVRLEQLQDSLEKASTQKKGWLNEEEKYAAMLYMRDESMINKSDRKVISVASYRSESEKSVLDAVEEPNVPFAEVIAQIFMWTRFRSKFFTLLPQSSAAEDFTGSFHGGVERKSSRRFFTDDIVQHIAPPHSPWKMPQGTFEAIIWVVTLPFQILFTFTVPDCRKPRLKKFYFATLGLSTAWLSVLTYAMIKMAENIGHLWGINPALLGFTLLAAGTSFPDFFSSMVVAKYGDGDMAVSNALGSNNFDILFGLGLPCLIKVLIYNRPEPVSTVGILSSIVILVSLLLFFIAAVLIGRFRLQKLTGIVFCIFYVGYIIYCMVHFLSL